MTRQLELTTGRLVALIIGIPLSLAAIGFIALTGVAYAGQGSYPVRLNIPVRGPTVTISLGSGELNGHQAAGDRLRVRGTARYALARSTVRVRQSSSGVMVASDCHLATWICSFDYKVAVPARARLNFSAGSGDITVTELTSPDVSAADGSGNITLTFATVPDRVTVDDALGNVTLILPPGSTAYKVSAQASLGTSVVRVPTSSRSPHVITVTDSSGNISITNGT